VTHGAAVKYVTALSGVI